MLQLLLLYGTMKSGRQDKHGFHTYWRWERRMAHLKPKQLLLIGLIVVIFCVLAAMTPLGARTAMMIRFQVAELSADNSNDEYGMDLGRFYVRNRKTIHCLKQMLFRTSCERIPIQTVCESTLEIPSYYLGERCFGADVFYEYQFGPVRYHLVFQDSDYRAWRIYIDSIYHSGGTGTGMVVG